MKATEIMCGDCVTFDSVICVIRKLCEWLLVEQHHQMRRARSSESRLFLEISSHGCRQDIISYFLVVTEFKTIKADPC